MFRNNSKISDKNKVFKCGLAWFLRLSLKTDNGTFRVRQWQISLNF